MPVVPRELIDAYAKIIKAEPDTNAAAAHMVNFVLDANTIAQAVEKAIEDAKARASQPAQQ